MRRITYQDVGQTLENSENDLFLLPRAGDLVGAGWTVSVKLVSPNPVTVTSLQDGLLTGAAFSRATSITLAGGGYTAGEGAVFTWNGVSWVVSLRIGLFVKVRIS